MNDLKTYILGKSIATAEQMSSYLLSINPNPIIKIPVLDFCKLFLTVGESEGVRGDLLFAQSCKETGYFKFRGTVKPEQNNYAGLGTTDRNTPGASFKDEATGILAQAQHVKGYYGAELNNPCVDPRYPVLVKCGKIGMAKYWEDLGGLWAVPGYDTKKYMSLEEANRAKDSYGYQIVKIFENMTGKVDENNMSTNNEKPLLGKKICLDAGHYSRYNRCPKIPEYYESVMVWKLHLYQKKYLEELGATVKITRSNQGKDLALVSRGKASEGCDLFISNHSNAVGNGMNEKIDHVAVYHLVDDNTTNCDEVSKEIACALAPVIAEVMGTKQGYKILSKKAESDRNKDGIKNDNYYGVLHGARLVNTPGLIVEHSFHTNTAAVRWLLKDANLDKLAKAEAEAIASYFSKRPVRIDTDTNTNTPTTPIIPSVPSNGAKVPYGIRVANVASGDVLNIRKEPNAKSDITGKLTYNDPNKYTIIEEKNGWGKLKSGIGWINLKYTRKV